MAKSKRIVEAVAIYFLLHIIATTSVHSASVRLDKVATYKNAIRVIPTLVSFDVETLNSDDIPEESLKPNSVNDNGLRICDSFYDYWPEEGQHGHVISFRMNNCSSTDPYCVFNVFNSETFEAKIIFQAGGISRNPRLLFDGVFWACGLIGCLPVWINFTPAALSFDGPLTNGTIYGITIKGFMSLDDWGMENPTYTFDSSYAAIGDYEDYDCECEEDENSVRPKILEQWENLEMCFETTIIYHKDKLV